MLGAVSDKSPADGHVVHVADSRGSTGALLGMRNTGDFERVDGENVTSLPSGLELSAGNGFERQNLNTTRT